MILAAKKAGAECIKFQHHIVSEEMLTNDVPKSNPVFELLKPELFDLSVEDTSKAAYTELPE